MARRIDPQGSGANVTATASRSGQARTAIFAALAGLVLGAAGTAWLQAAERQPNPRKGAAAKTEAVAASALPSALSEAERQAVDVLIRRYFATWSTPDIDAYGRCFHPNARVWFGSGSSLALAPFLDSQRQAHAQSPVRLTEDPLAWEITGNNGLAHVRVHWELHRGAENVRGYDFFTLVHTEGRWQIIALIFNEE